MGEEKRGKNYLITNSMKRTKQQLQEENNEKGKKSLSKQKPKK